MVEGLLSPVDVDVTRPFEPLLGHGGATSREQDRYMRTRRIHNRARCVGSPHNDVNHDRLRSTGDTIENEYKPLL